jgi:hypothetical protein
MGELIPDFADQPQVVADGFAVRPRSKAAAAGSMEHADLLHDELGEVLAGLEFLNFVGWFKRRCFWVARRTLSGLPSR